jgi:hypothetical protein
MNINKKRGFLHTIILVVIGVILLLVFRKEVEALMNTELFKKLWSSLLAIWNFLWQTVKLGWELLVDIVYKIAQYLSSLSK